MSAVWIWRLLPLKGWLWVGAGFLALVLLLRLAVDPWGGGGARQARAEAAANASAAKALADVRQLEHDAVERQAQRVRTYHDQQLLVGRDTMQAVADAERGRDARTPLGGDRIGRLGAHDSRLCERATALRGC